MLTRELGNWRGQSKSCVGWFKYAGVALCVVWCVASSLLCIVALLFEKRLKRRKTRRKRRRRKR